jgi:hypothetical protein
MFALNQGEIYLPSRLLSSWDIYDVYRRVIERTGAIKWDIH